MLKNYIVILFIFHFLIVDAQGRIEGYVKDLDSIPLAFSSVTLFQNDSLFIGTITDFDGYYFLENIPKGKYLIIISSIFSSSIQKDIFIEYNISTSFNFYIKTESAIFYGEDFFTIPNLYKYPELLIDKKSIKEQNNYNINKLISNNSHINLIDKNKLQYTTRVNSIKYIQDGIPLINTTKIPTFSIYDIRIFEHGIPAKYGNTTSAVIEINTKSYFNYFD